MNGTILAIAGFHPALLASPEIHFRAYFRADKIDPHRSAMNSPS
jgi:hypothetical protein